MDAIVLTGLEVPCRIGCSAEERLVPQSLRVDLELRVSSLSKAGHSDDLQDTVDYRIGTQMIAALQGGEYNLVERVAEILAAVALRDPRIQEVQVTVTKRPPVPSLAGAGVRIVRRR